MASRDLRWRRPMSTMEVRLLKKAVSISYILRLCTSRELTLCDVTRGLVSLYRITPNLRMTAQERDGVMWLRERTQEHVDLQVLENADPHAVFHEMLDYSYPEEGPCWAARFLPWSSAQQDYVNLTKMATQQNHLCTCHLILSFSHYLTDGFTIMRTIRIFLGLLDDVLAGRPIDDHTQVAELIDTKHEIEIFKEIEKEFIEHPQLLERAKYSYKNFITEIMIDKAYTAPTNVKPTTITLSYIFNKKITKEFIARCKSKQISFHAAFSSVIDAAIVKFLLDSNFDRSYYKISSKHCINQRQYFKDCDRCFGCGIGDFDIVCVTPKNVLKQFWSYAEVFNLKLKKQQAQKVSFQYHVMHNLTGIEPSSRMQKANPPDTGFHYATTNMLDVTGVVGNCGSHVALDYYDRLTTMKTIPTFWLSGFQTFRGQLMHSFMYNVHHMTNKAAKNMADNIQEIFSKVVLI